MSLTRLTNMSLEEVTAGLLCNQPGQEARVLQELLASRELVVNEASDVPFYEEFLGELIERDLADGNKRSFIYMEQQDAFGTRFRGVSFHTNHGKTRITIEDKDYEADLMNKLGLSYAIDHIALYAQIMHVRAKTFQLSLLGPLKDAPLEKKYVKALAEQFRATKHAYLNTQVRDEEGVFNIEFEIDKTLLLTIRLRPQQCVVGEDDREYTGSPFRPITNQLQLQNLRLISTRIYDAISRKESRQDVA